MPWTDTASACADILGYVCLCVCLCLRTIGVKIDTASTCDWHFDVLVRGYGIYYMALTCLGYAEDIFSARRHLYVCMCVILGLMCAHWTCRYKILQYCEQSEAQLRKWCRLVTPSACWHRYVITSRYPANIYGLKKDEGKDAWTHLLCWSWRTNIETTKPSSPSLRAVCYKKR